MTGVHVLKEIEGDLAALLDRRDERVRGAAMPITVRLALKVLLEHVEPGWDNCTTVVKAWLETPTERTE